MGRLIVGSQLSVLSKAIAGGLLCCAQELVFQALLWNTENQLGRGKVAEPIASALGKVGELIQVPEESVS